MGEFIKYIFYSIIGSLIFLFLYSLWFNPSMIDNLWENVKDKVKDSSINLDLQKEEDVSITTCLNEIRRKFEIDETKAPIKTRHNIKEYKKFNNNSDAENYLNEWGFNTFSFGGDILISSKDWFDKEHNDIIIVLVKRGISFDGNTISALYPHICIDGKFQL